MTDGPADSRIEFGQGVSNEEKDELAAEVLSMSADIESVHAKLVELLPEGSSFLLMFDKMTAGKRGMIVLTNDPDNMAPAASTWAYNHMDQEIIEELGEEYWKGAN